jgi:O-antigen/teichoic acid export membrane protein
LLEPFRYLIRLLRGDRGWSLAAAFANRLAGFITSFILARFAGTAVLGGYTAVANTASAVVSPVLFSIANGATVDVRRPDAKPSAVFHAHGLLAAVIAIPCGVGFLVLAWRLDESEHLFAALAITAGVIAVASQLVTGAFQGVLYGAGEFRRAALAAIAVAAAGLAAAIPAVLAWGLRGALLVLIGSSIILPAALARLQRGPRATGELAESFGYARAQLARSVPSIGATGVAALASWLTSVYLVEDRYGSAGLGVIAIGTQWLTLSVLAVTSWGGVLVRALVVARDAGTFGREIRSQVAKNVAITVVASAALLVGADLIARLYHASDTPVASVLRINAATAIVMAINNVAERALYCSNRQRGWLVSSLAGACVTVVLAALLVARGIAYVPVAMLCGYGVTAVLSFGLLGAS